LTGTEEDGVTEAGRSAEPPLMAPPGRDATPDGATGNTVAQNGLMSAPARPASSRSGAGRPDASGDADGKEAPGERAARSPADVPFPADGIGQPKGTAAGAGKSSAGTPGTAAGAGAGAPAAADVGTASGTGSSSAVPVKPQPSFTPAETADTAASSSGRPVTPDAGRPSWRGAYTPPQPTVESQPTAAAAQQAYPPQRSAADWAPARPSDDRGTAVAAATAAATPASGNVAGPASAAWGNRGPSVNSERDAARRSRRQAHLTLARVEPWSVMKFSFVVSVVAFVILFVAIAILYMALSGLGVFTSLQHTVSTVTSSQGSSGTDISGWFSASRILGYAGMLGALNIVLITAMSTIGAVIYNLIAHTIGGVEVTLRETE
jgi:hypothetical protein